MSSPPLVVGDVVVVGSAMTEGTGYQEAPPGHVRGYDVRTGRMQWIFHTIPQPGEFGHDTWEDDSWKDSGGVNVWTLMSAEPELGYVYLPIGTPVSDYYGGHRLGDNLFADSLVCLDAETGEPVWPIEERPVPQSTVPGERTSPTQPYPTKPPLFLTNGAVEEDLIDFTPELRAEALEIFGEHHAGPLYTPPALGSNIVRPGWSGGANWWGAAFDPDTGRFYVPSWAHFSVVRMAAGDPERSDMTIRPRVSSLGGPQQLPLFKPPYAQLAAFDMNRGEKLWSIPMGDGPRDHDALRGMDLPPLGTFEKVGGPLLTKTLLFIGQGLESNYLWAIDKATGHEVWEMELPAQFYAAPITYLAGGRQYLVLAIGGADVPEQLVALALP